ncbi:hypothetical protein M422DRAFT_258640 [Sphaerobolus stellatus SS14]|uniref:Anaphase-promoting complex subunit 5 n=1 Tax=Sphaerobolus stellatus (strain SS14) TaxID=990650 RepID=A0A0C9VLP9_SPHS4|nr:hypothetical protein M422DRAFT_258640 [Sphaerobolus stellatus SS14]
MIHDLESSLENLEDAREVLGALNLHADLSMCLRRLDRAHYDMGRFKEGLDSCEQGIHEAEYTENEYQLADALHIASIGLIYLSRTEEALKYSERALLACKRSGEYSQVSAAILELMGFIYLERMDLSTARIAYKVATDHAFSLIGKTYLAEETSNATSLNLKLMERMEENCMDDSSTVSSFQIPTFIINADVSSGLLSSGGPESHSEYTRVG